MLITYPTIFPNPSIHERKIENKRRVVTYIRHNIDPKSIFQNITQGQIDLILCEMLSRPND